ncbi:hypothetical protein PX52LOC_02742 [Limnoglobus roseus]|uniref:Terminase large subunit gp17-like C-terminal domain-containing protein n=2 Tax=Limnoglobus roseus TaxID=2598579 RepID=A0A5C1ACT4_9BACT|nr:hypothetical protein PX52LOC_02742 [Limnoglobus roseus]
MLALQHQIAASRRGPNEFIEFCFTDPVGRAIQQAPFHRDLQLFLTAHRKALIELPRDHGKSTQVCGRILWELGHRPNLRVKLVCSTDALAAERTRFLRDAIKANRYLRMVFPYLLPAQPWAADAFTVERPADVIGPSVAAFGVGSGSTGARADLLVCDDVVDVAAVASKAERDKVTGFFHDNLLNLLEPDGRFWGLFTPWREQKNCHNRQTRIVKHETWLSALISRRNEHSTARVLPARLPTWPCHLRSSCGR